MVLIITNYRDKIMKNYLLGVLRAIYSIFKLLEILPQNNFMLIKFLFDRKEKFPVKGDFFFLNYTVEPRGCAGF